MPCQPPAQDQPFQPSNDTATNEGSTFVDTLEYRRFAEFCDACRQYRYIGLCFGPPGVGKTLSAVRYSRTESANQVAHGAEPPPGSLPFDTALYTPSMLDTPSLIEVGIRTAYQRLQDLAKGPVRREARTVLDALRVRNEEARRIFQETPSNRWQDPPNPTPTYFEMMNLYKDREDAIGDPTTLVVIDEADRLKLNSLEHLRDRFDRGGTGLILVGMPGMEKRMARYPQFYSRIGFVHEFRPLSADGLRELLERGWTPPGVALPKGELTADAVAAILRITGGNFRLLARLLTQIERILTINALDNITPAVVQTARESLVIGQA
jgi:AAA domain